MSGASPGRSTRPVKSQAVKPSCSVAPRQPWCNPFRCGGLLFSNTGGDAHGHDHLGNKAVARGLAVAAGRSVRNCLLAERGFEGLVAQVVTAAHAGDGPLLHDDSRCPQVHPNRAPAEIEEIVQLIRLEL